MSFANFKAPTPLAFALTPAEAEAEAEPEVGWVSHSAHVTLSLVMNGASEVGFGSESFRFRLGLVGKSARKSRSQLLASAAAG